MLRYIATLLNPSTIPLTPSPAILTTSKLSAAILTVAHFPAPCVQEPIMRHDAQAASAMGKQSSERRNRELLEGQLSATFANIGRGAGGAGFGHSVLYSPAKGRIRELAILLLMRLGVGDQWNGKPG